MLLPYLGRRDVFERKVYVIMLKTIARLFFFHTFTF